MTHHQISSTDSQTASADKSNQMFSSSLSISSSLSHFNLYGGESLTLLKDGNERSSLVV